MKIFFALHKDEQREIISITSQKYNLPFEVVEKDVWLCWILDVLFQLPEKMVFKGGTSLSKLGYISRFSEDVDVTVNYKNFLPELDLTTNISNSQLRKASDFLKDKLKVYINTVVVPALKKSIQNTFTSADEYTVEANDDGETVEFKYKTSGSGGYLLDHVLLEFGARNTTEPSDEKNITPYILDLAKNIVVVPTPKVNVLSPIRTFWEKATLIHVECNKHRLGTAHGYRLSRHWYDLYWLSNAEIGSKAMQSLYILKDVIMIKKAFYNSAQASYDDCLEGKLRLIPSTDGYPSFKKGF